MEKTCNIYEFVNGKHSTKIAAYATVVEHENYIYCKYFEVNKDYRGEGYGKSIVDGILITYPDNRLDILLLQKIAWVQNFGIIIQKIKR